MNTFHLIELIGVVAITLALISSSFQFLYVNKHHNTESFSFEYLFLMIIVEFLWFTQGLCKQSYTISFAKAIGCAYFAWLFFLSVKHKLHEGKKFKDLFYDSNKSFVKNLKHLLNSFKKKFKNVGNNLK